MSNLNPQKFENLIHRFFKDVQLQIDILGEGNERVSPREWFVVPYPIIERVIDLFISGEIVTSMLGKMRLLLKEDNGGTSFSILNLLTLC